MLDLAKNSAALFLAKSLLLGTRVVALLAMAGFLAPDQVARASYVIALAEMFRWFADWGTDTWCIRAIALAPDNATRAQHVTSVLCVKVLGCVAFASALLVICIARPDLAGLDLGFIGVGLLLAGQISGLAISYLQASQLIRRILVVTLPCVMTAIATVAVVRVTHSVTATMMTLTVGELLLAGILLRLLSRYGVLRRDHVSIRSIKSVIRESSSAAALNLVVGLHSRLDTIVLAQMSIASLATYTVAHRLFLPFQVAVTTLGAVIYSATASAIAAGRESPKTFYLQELPLTLLMSACAGTVLWFAGRVIISNYLQGFTPAIEVLNVLCVVVVVLGCGTAFAARAIAHGRISVAAVIATMDLVFTGAAMLFLVPTHGAVGAATALLFGASMNLLVTLCYVSFRLEPHKLSAAPR